MSAWLNEIGATGYRVALLRNSGVSNVNFLPVTYTFSRPGESAKTVLHKMSTESYLPANYPEGVSGEGARAIEDLETTFTTDVLSLTLPRQANQNQVDRTNVSAVLVTPEFSRR
jgi:hypothetical protein